MNIEENGSIIASDCPNQYCCQAQDGCDYVDDAANLCALHRDPDTPLCGKCVEGYSELLGTVNCGICDGDYYQYLLIPIANAAALSILLLCCDRSSRPPPPGMTGIVNLLNLYHCQIVFHLIVTLDRMTDDPPSPMPFDQNEALVPITGKDLVRDDIRGLLIMVLKVLLYYGQGLVAIMAQSTIQSGLFYFILPILQIFNLSIDFGVSDNSEGAGYCFVEGMTAEQEILFDLTIPELLLFITAFMAITRMCGMNWLKYGCCCCSQITEYAAFLRALIISIGSITAVIFKVLSCRDIAGSDMSVHFYYGNTECHGTSWYAALLTLAGLLIIWMILDIVTWRQGVDVRQDPARNHLFALVKAFRPGYVAIMEMTCSSFDQFLKLSFCVWIFEHVIDVNSECGGGRRCYYRGGYCWLY